MTLIQMPFRPRNADSGHRTPGDAPEAAVPQICDDMTVEVALSVMASAREGHLLVCDQSGVYTGRVTQAQLVAVRAGDAYTDRLRLRDVPALAR
ncbi:CBS domain-containing protein [Streptomyces virginiae]|uniref:CBS domain-containing protein n=1 Tax=Streptomyces virginiae TaxID=1961 RepID=UPI0036E142B5